MIEIRDEGGLLLTCVEGDTLRAAQLSGAEIRGADLERADLEGADLRGANLSGATGLLDPIEFLAQFERDADGALIAYKTFDAAYDVPSYWTILPGATLREIVNPCRTDPSGSGINVAPLAWVMREFPAAAIWRVRIPVNAFPSIVVPYGTTGEFRVGQVEVVEQVRAEEKQ